MPAYSKVAKGIFESYLPSIFYFKVGTFCLFSWSRYSSSCCSKYVFVWSNNLWNQTVLAKRSITKE
jgi:hypothetical protein